MKILKSKKLLATVAVGLMISLVAGMGAMTFARYISTAQVPTQQATAAKWGFVVTANADKLFSTDYIKDTGDYATVVTENGVAVRAVADTQGKRANLVAPGTTGSMTVSVTGSAEVSAKLTIAAGNSFKDVYIPEEKNGETVVREAYYPIKWTLTKKVGESATADVLVDRGSIDAFLRAIADESTELEAGESVSVVYTITWAWDFNGDNSDAAQLEASKNDTLIGYKTQGVPYENLANLLSPTMNTYKSLISQTTYNDISTTLQFDLSVTVEQIQSLTPAQNG